MYLLKMNLKKITDISLKYFYWSNLLFNDKAQLYLIFQMLYYTFKRLSLNVFQTKTLLLPKLLVIVFLHQLTGTGDSNFCLSFKKRCLKQKKK